MSEEFEIEDLPSGEQVRVYPDGRKYLIRGASPAKAAVEQALPDLMESANELRAKQVAAIEAKIAQMESGNEVPPEKRSL